MIPVEHAGVDPAEVAAAARRLRGLLPPPPRTVFVVDGWRGPASGGAAAALGATLTAYDQARLAVEETADALAATAVALAAALDLLGTADRLAAAEGPALDPAVPGGVDPAVVATLARLRGDAADQMRLADARCAARLVALRSARVPVLPPLVSPVSPEQTALRLQQLGGWGAVPTALVGPVAAVLGESAVAASADAPVEAREIAAELALADDPALLAPEADGTPRRYLQATPDGGVAEVWGDLATAQHVVVIVPGTGTSKDSFDSAQQQGDATYDELRRQAGPDVAVVVWDGSEEPPNPALAALESYARSAAPKLKAFVEGLPLAAGAALTLVGHSYGSVVTGEAVHAGLRPAALIGVAPAGFGPGVRSGADLGVPTYEMQKAEDAIGAEWDVEGLLRDVGDGPILGTEHVLAGLLPFGRRLPQLTGPGDVVTDLAGAAGLGDLGTAPGCLPDVTRLATGDDGLALPYSIATHGSYFEPGSTSLQEIVAVAVGAPVRTAPGHCPILAP